VVLLLAAWLFFRNSFADEEVVELSSVSLTTQSQANALLTASGYIVAQRKASIASKATGRIVYLGFKEGDRVKKGDVIARIESADVEAALAQARADLEVAKADRNDAAQSLDRARQLFSRQLISQSELDAAQSRYDRVVASIQSRDAGVQAANVQLENTRIRAPFDGTILTKNADIGEVVAPFAAGASSRVAVVTLADMTSLEVEADVSESNIERIAPQQPCEISLNAYPDSRYPGMVDKIVPTADRAKATVLTKVKFLKVDGRVLPEMGAKVHFLSSEARSTGDEKPKVTVDPAALIARDGHTVAFVVRDRAVMEVGVTTGEAVGRLVEVTGGLSVGDKVVLKPSARLRSGSVVKLKQ
jgi:RND family efflux transporter MFP subunit